MEIKLNKLKEIIVGIAIICSASCDSNQVVNTGNKKINLTDQSTVITETDTAYLGNIVEDITNNSTTKSNQQIVKNVIQQVDSAKEASTIAATEINEVNGTNIECKDFTVTIGTLMNQAVDHYTVSSFDKLANTKIQTNGIANPSIEQINFTKVKVKIGSEEYVLDDLQEFKNKPIILTKTDNIFACSSNALQFRELTNKGILLATDRALRKANKSKKEIDVLPKLLAQTNTFSDTPCEVFTTAIQFKISGIKNGKKVSELIKVTLQ